MSFSSSCWAEINPSAQWLCWGTVAIAADKSAHGLHLQTHLAAEARHHLALFEVGLPIEVGSLQVADPLLVRGVEQQDVCRDGLVTLQLHKVPHSDIFPALLHVSMFLPVALKAYQG